MRKRKPKEEKYGKGEFQYHNRYFEGEEATWNYKVTHEF